MAKQFYRSTLFFFLAICNVAAQKHDFNWVLGTSHPKGDLLNFSNYDLKISMIDKTVPFFITNTTMSTFSGEYAFSFNSWGIQDSQFQLMDNSDSLSLSSIPVLFDNYGGPFTQGSIALPSQRDTNRFLLFYWDFYQYAYMPGTPSYAPFHLYMAIIDKSGNDGKGSVIQKNILLISDTLANAGMTATKHANGRDWWVVAPEAVSNRYQTLLIAGDSVSQAFSQSIGIKWPVNVDVTSPALFTPSGSKYVRFSDEVGLQVFKFDRCTGQFSDPLLVPFEFDEGYFSGLSFSRDSRFAYVTDIRHLYQYDLEANDIPSSETLIDIYDGHTNPYACDFRNPQLAPDGKIYVNSNGGCLNLHVIEHPERKGLACGFRQHGITLNTFTVGGLPNMPNYRLGPEENSACDSLGIDNIPMAGFRYGNGSMDILNIEFTDLSDYEPENWVWDFGDGQSSVEQYPTHHYDSTGTYQVCLTVSNQNGSDTYCKTIQLSTSSAIDDIVDDNFVYYDFETAQLMTQGVRLKNIKIFDISGRIAKDINAVPSSFIDMNDLKSGLYFWQAVNHNGKLLTGKFVKI